MDQTSTGFPYFCSIKISGATYSGDPQAVWKERERERNSSAREVRVDKVARINF